MESVPGVILCIFILCHSSYQQTGMESVPGVILCVYLYSLTPHTSRLVWNLYLV